MLNNRLLCELALLDEFKESHKFVKEYDIISDDPLSLEITLNVKRHDYVFNVIFNKYFPYQPIEIIAKTTFRTSHMYKNGAMCLKHGQDNWNIDITLIDLIDDLYELLYIENPLGKKHDDAPSGDHFTLGQVFRNSKELTLLLPIKYSELDKKTGAIKYNLNKDTGILFVTSINENNYYKTNCGKESSYVVSSDPYNNECDNEIRTKLNLDKSKDVFVIFSNEKCVFLSGKDDDSIKMDCLTFHYDVGNRINIKEEILNKKITIIGLGSIGSRVAVDLARAGFNNFYFVDDDIFLPHNIVRHELTSRDFGDYKVVKLKEFINNYINNEIKIETSTLAMTGQESSSSTNRFLNNCEDSSIIIDCTGCDSVLLTLNKLTADNNIPVISGTVIPGGFGNIILVKKQKDIDLESILSSYYCWANNKRIFAERINDYSSASNDQTYTATMSDCSILSGLIGKITIDLLSGRSDLVSNINVFSTSDYYDLSEFYRAFKVNANEVIKKEDNYDEKLIEKGNKIYEDYCSTRDNKQNT